MDDLRAQVHSEVEGAVVRVHPPAYAVFGLENHDRLPGF
jgi:hypothetical protein